ACALLRRDDDLLPRREQPRRRQLADAELRALEVGDERERPAGVLGGVANQAGPGAMLRVVGVREVQARRVHPGVDQRREPVVLPARGPDRREDLRPPRWRGHTGKGSAGGHLTFGVFRVAIPVDPSLSPCERVPAGVLRPPSSSSIRSSWLYFATRSVREGAAVLICPTPVATARSAIVVSSVSPERCDMTAA